MTRAAAPYLLTVVLFLVITDIQDRGYAGPHHDEVIALLASKALEGDFAARKVERQPPFDLVVPASVWHRFTHDFTPVGFQAIRHDVQSFDTHPPLGFWLFNRWLSLFDHGGYHTALWLTRWLILMSGAVLAFTVFRLTAALHPATFAFALFLTGNSAMFTASWVRQYALFTLLFGLTLLCAAELARRDLDTRTFMLLAIAMGLVASLSMLTQYTYLTASGPLHAVLVLTFVIRSAWKRFLAIVIAYTLAAALFILLAPGSLRHATAASAGLALRSNWLGALSGIPKTVIPVPGSVPTWGSCIAGALIVLLTLFAGFVLSKAPAGSADRTIAPLILSGLLGSGVLQLILVGAGAYPEWATGPNHMVPFWMLTILAAVVAARRLSHATQRGLAILALLGLLGMQAIYTAHLHRIRPHTNAAYIDRLKPALVYLDSPDRGSVLELTEVMSSGQPVLVASASRLRGMISGGELAGFDRILYLKMPSSVETRDRVETILGTFELGGWKATTLPVVHPGVYDAILLERP